MTTDRKRAIAEFKRIMIIIAVIAVLMVVAALTYLYMFSTLDANTVLAVTFGVLPTLRRRSGNASASDPLRAVDLVAESRTPSALRTISPWLRNSPPA